MFKQNESDLDKNIRLAVGIISLLLGVFTFSGTMQILAFIVAGLGIFTGLSGFCFLYKLLGINTKK